MGISRRWGILGLALTLALTAGAQGAVIYVKQGGAGNNDGASWANAYALLESALQAAQSGDEIWIAAGTYYPTNTYDLDAGDPRNAHFRMKNGVGIYGGFAGTETTRIQRNVASNVVVLSGDIGNPGDTADNCYHVFYNPGTLGLDGTAILDGVTITGGNANGNLDQQGCGGGMYNCGLYQNYSSLTMVHILFTGNMARNNGGGVCNIYSSPNVMNCFFSGNHAINDGGGMYNSYSRPVLANCVFKENSANYGGGIRDDTGDPTSGTGLGSTTFINCTFTGNTAVTSGGAFSETGSAASNFHNCILWGDTAPSSPEIHTTIWGQNEWSCCDVQGSIDYWSDAGNNIHADPLLLDPAHGDLHLRARSPCIDKGFGDNLATVPATDLAAR